MSVEKQSEAFILAAQAEINRVFAKEYPKQTPPVLSLEHGSRYARIIKSDGVSRSAMGFVEIETGNLLKADGWKRPAKGIRGNVANLDGCLARFSVYGGVS